MARILIVLSIALAFVGLSLTLATAAAVAVGAGLSYFVPAIPLEFACMIGALAILVILACVSTVFQLLRLANSLPTESNDDESDDEDESEEFAERIAELVSQRLGPHFGKLRRPKSRTR